MSERTRLQRDADQVDAELYSLMRRIERLAREHTGSHATWINVGRALREARPAVRTMMHGEDLASTS